MAVALSSVVVDVIENRTFDEIRVGEGASLTRTLTADDLQLVAAVSGDVDPAHVEVWGATVISTLLATKLPGPGAICLSQHLQFRRPIGLGDTLTASVTATAKDPATHRVSLDCRCVNQAGEVVVDGSAEMIAGSTKVTANAWRRSFARPRQATDPCDIAICSP